MLFPARVIETLHALRGEPWRALVEQVMHRPDIDPDVLAFSLMMIRLGNCLGCRSDSYRAMRGCTLCAQQTILRFKGSDEELVHLWEEARAEVTRWLAEVRGE
jgi:hypothetical protein